MRTTDTPGTACPYCGRPNNCHTGRDGTTPDTGDLSVCWHCRRPAVFVNGPDGLRVRVPTAAEKDEISAQPDYRAALGAMAESYDPHTAAALWAGGRP